MQRVIVVGQPGQCGPLPSDQFAQMLAVRLGAKHLPLSLKDVQEQAMPSEPYWVMSEPAGAFSEQVFRAADTVVWLHFSPIAFLRDWCLRSWEQFQAVLVGYQCNTPRAQWDDVKLALSYQLIAPELRRLFAHPALAHLRLIELHSPQQAEFWLMTQRKLAYAAA